TLGIFFFQAEDGIRDRNVTGVQTCALPISLRAGRLSWGFGAAARDTAGALVRATNLLGLSSLVFRTSLFALGTSVKYVRETLARSEERRVGKECGYRGPLEHSGENYVCR